MSLVTSGNDVRHLTFNPETNSAPFTNSLPSPDIPFSGRKSGSVPLGTPPQLIDSQVHDSPWTVGRSPRYIDVDLAAVLLGAATDTTSASIKMSFITGPTEKAFAHVAQLIATHDTQLEVFEALAHVPSQRLCN